MSPSGAVPDMRIFILTIGLAALAAPAGAQTATATFNAAFPEFVRLSLSTSSLTFPDADPDSVPQVAALPALIDITTKGRVAAGGTVTLTVQAADDLRSGTTTLPAALITWTATGTGFTAGTLSAASPQVVGSWTGSGVHTGTQSFLFRNLWTHPSGTYTVTLLYTLSAA